MEFIEGVKAFTIFAGSTMVGGEILAYYLKNRLEKNKNKLANGNLISKNDILDILGNDGLILSKDIQLKEKYDYEGSVIFGATGSKKTTSTYVPNLLKNNLKGSIVVTDPKGELFKITSGYQKEVCKRKVLKFSPLEPEYSEKYNLLTSCKDNMEVLELAQSLIFNGCLSIELSTGKKVGGMEWIQMAQPYLASALLYCKDLEYPFNTIEFAFQLLITLKDKELDVLFTNSKNYDCITQWRIYKTVGKADRTEGSIKITFATNMQLFVDERINKACGSTTFNFEDFRKEPTILYICYPEHKANYISPFIAPFLSKMFNDLIECYNKKSLPITFLCDEAGNIGQITNLANKVSTVRSREISVNICLQGLTQLYQIYGKDNATTILNNLKTKLIFPSMSDEEALKYISTLCGEKEIETISRNENKSGTSTSYNKTKIRMFSESDLRCLNDDEFLLITSNKQPILSKQNTYFTNNEYTQNIKEPVKIERKPVKRYDLLDHIEDLKVDLAIEKEDNFDIRKDLFR
ncbi:type IV secretory system conjugative DNA transfer family protein [Clostridium beijerinckii]|uniref:type IV secretory system conjugative DNA transfer family protein n=2 Tax=Bacteria TaxID=2 RepID=UPI001360E5D1|nr:type IV secretory system conjugative DNA transfer family protein [Clostridium beijerinckii]MZK53312.1 type IV secretory system conjugative DNA transfer family protein [Clostridium beijerinckii]MZK61417.1 type IV secretory system conjugative DNA transfer family protein [Clostridium beijerinckii]MZK71659.1 type IV secretory system conjugative DNA transfer family protein [Clostridium beijerinckii]MZK77052.1 type IV secretory system conjugative DNA transfer family protein [Clostridium beijerinck